MKQSDSTFRGHRLTCLFTPGRWMHSHELATLAERLLAVCAKRNFALKYGPFMDGYDRHRFREFFSSANLCIITRDREDVAFFYHYILREPASGFTAESAVVHLGLVLVARSPGFSVVREAYSVLSTLELRLFGPHYITSISQNAALVTFVSQAYADVWPRARVSLRKPPQDYMEKLDLLRAHYIEPYFPRGSSLDRKRFTVHYPKEEAGSFDPLASLPKDRLEDCALLTAFTGGNEQLDLIQVGRMDHRVAICERARLVGGEFAHRLMEARTLYRSLRARLGTRRLHYCDSQPEAALESGKHVL